VRVDPPAGHPPRVRRSTKPLVHLLDDGPWPAVRRELERGQPHLEIGASQPDQPAVTGINAVAAHLVRRQRRQAQQPGLHLAVELVEFYRPVPGLGILWLRRLGPDAPGPVAFQLRPEPPQGIRKLGAGVRTQSAVHGGGSHNTADRMIGRQQVQQLVA
jgi:hypothetical protein